MILSIWFSLQKFAASQVFAKHGFSVLNKASNEVICELKFMGVDFFPSVRDRPVFCHFSLYIRMPKISSYWKKVIHNFSFNFLILNQNFSKENYHQGHLIVPDFRVLLCFFA